MLKGNKDNFFIVIVNNLCMPILYHTPFHNVKSILIE